MERLIQSLLQFHDFSESIAFRGTKALHNHPTSETGTLLRKEAKANSAFLNIELPNNVEVDVIIESKGLQLVTYCEYIKIDTGCLEDRRGLLRIYHIICPTRGEVS